MAGYSPISMNKVGKFFVQIRRQRERKVLHLTHQVLLQPHERVRAYKVSTCSNKLRRAYAVLRIVCESEKKT